MDLTNVKSRAMSRTGGSGTRESARAEGVQSGGSVRVKGVCR